MHLADTIQKIAFGGKIFHF